MNHDDLMSHQKAINQEMSVELAAGKLGKKGGGHSGHFSMTWEQKELKVPDRDYLTGRFMPNTRQVQKKNQPTLNNSKHSLDTFPRGQ